MRIVDLNLDEMIGKPVMFNQDTEKTELDVDNGMLAIFSGYKDKGDGCFELFFDFSIFEEYNKLLMKPHYYDKDHRPTLTWAESCFYPDNKKFSYYFDEKDELCFNFIPTDSPFLKKFDFYGKNNQSNTTEHILDNDKILEEYIKLLRPCLKKAYEAGVKDAKEGRA